MFDEIKARLVKPFFFLPPVVYSRPYLSGQTHVHKQVYVMNRHFN